jgi:hypothetical protein
VREGACIGAATMLQLIALRWHSSSSEVRFGLPVGL